MRLKAPGVTGGKEGGERREGKGEERGYENSGEQIEQGNRIDESVEKRRHGSCDEGR